MKKIYISCPYSHPDATIREQRYRQCVDHFVSLQKLGQLGVSPVMIGHPIYETDAKEFDYSFWIEMSEQLLKDCDEVHVLKFDGWRHSQGVQLEIRLAQRLNIKTVFFPYE